MQRREQIKTRRNWNGSAAIAMRRTGIRSMRKETDKYRREKENKKKSRTRSGVMRMHI
jgi:hypothetical protein